LFFRHTIRIWLTYAGILLLLIGVLVWFSWFTWQLDWKAQASQQAIRRAEFEAAQQERISRALWRLDWVLSPLVAQEAARTHWMYQSFLPSSENATQQPSPLLMRPSAWVLLHFQINAQDEITSPQAPDRSHWKVAKSFVDEQELSINSGRLQEISSQLRFEPMWQACSATMLAQSADSSLAWLPTSTNAANIGGLPLGYNASVASNPRQELLVDNEFNQEAEAQSQQLTPRRNAVQSQALEFLQRSQATNTMALGQRQANYYSDLGKTANSAAVTEGTLRPIWMDGRLLLVRRVESGHGKLVQGCWLDWQAIKAALLQEITDIIDRADLVPREISDGQFGKALATLPVDLVAPMEYVDQEMQRGASGTRNALLVAWSGLIVGAISTGWLIFGVTKLSERRAAFASAVTHELRTPLTTFRLYSEMLANNMVGDPQQRQAYTQGLVRESERLCRLVENVLQFARLEKKSPSVTSIETTVEDLVRNTIQRCQERAGSCGMQLVLCVSDEVAQAKIRSSADLVDQVIFNLVDNACKYAHDSTPPEIRVEIGEELKWIVFAVRDFGSGIDSRMIKRLFQPFSRSADETAGTAAGVGLGLILSRKLAQQLGGRLDFRQASPGSIFELRLRKS
jgi:signal transduction histidine kinase